MAPSCRNSGRDALKTHKCRKHRNWSYKESGGDGDGDETTVPVSSEEDARGSVRSQFQGAAGEEEEELLHQGANVHRGYQSQGQLQSPTGKEITSRECHKNHMCRKLLDACIKK